MNIIKNMFKNTLWLGAAQVFNTLIGLTLSILLARYLGDINYGKYIFVIAFLNIFAVFVNFGFSNYFVNEISQDTKKLKKYLQNTLAIKLFINLVYLAVVFITINLSGKDGEVKSYIYIASVTLIFTSVLDLYYAIFRSHNKMIYQAIFNSLVSVFNLLFIFICIYLKFSLYFIFWGLLISSAVNIVITTLFINKRYVPVRLKFDFRLWKKLLLNALPFILSAVFIKIYNDMDQVMLSFIKGDRITGWYGADYKVLMAINMAGLVYYNVYHPVVARLYNKNKEKLILLTKASIKIIYMIVLPTATGISILSRDVILLVFGNEYVGGSFALKILIWTVVFTLITQAFGKVLQVSKNMKIYTASIGLGAIVNVILNFLLIPSFSLNGAAVSTVLSLFVVFVCMYFSFYKKIAKLNIATYIIKPFIASIFMGTLVYYIKQFNLNIFYLIISGVFSYVLIILIIGGIKTQDLKLIKSLILTKK